MITLENENLVNIMWGECTYEYTHKSPNQLQELGKESTKKGKLNKYNQNIITQYPNGYQSYLQYLTITILVN